MGLRRGDLSGLKNIGPTIERRLNEIGILTRADLERIGSIKAYRLICDMYPDRTIPVCYYLCLLQGALMDLHWDDLPKALKSELLTAAKRRA